MQDKLLKIINHYGIDNQRRRLQEEVTELLDEILLFEKGIGDINNIISEMADVSILLWQFQEYYEIKDLELLEVRDFKVNRTLDEIEHPEKRIARKGE